MNSVSIAGSAESIFLVMSGNLHSNCDVLCEEPVQSGVHPEGGIWLGVLGSANCHLESLEKWASENVCDVLSSLYYLIGEESS